MVFAAFFVLGIMSIFRVGQELFPDVELPTMVVVAISPGVAPTEIESQITRPIEDAIAGLNGVERISSFSNDSVSRVVINFREGTSLDDQFIDVREALTVIEDRFPEGTERPGIFKFSATSLPSIELNVYSTGDGVNVRRLVEDILVPRIERIPGVGQAAVFGGTDRAVLVELDVDSLAQTGIPIQQVLQVFSGENITLPAGTVTTGDRTVSLRTVGEFVEVEDIGSIVVGYRDSVPIFLRELAAITLAARPQEEYARSRGGEAVRISVQKQPDYNTVDVNDAVLAAIEASRSTLPPSIAIEVQTNQADAVRDSIGGVADAGWQGGLLAILVLLIFLRNLRSTIIVSAAIPVAVIATLSLIDFAGMTLNITSLMGITLAIGMFVDNAIVVLESIFRKQLAGLPPDQAAIEGTEEVGKAVTASTLTSMAVFLPMLFVGGMAGALFQDLSLTIAFSLFMSLAAAISLIPVLASKFLKVPPAEGGLADHEVSLADVVVHTRSPLLNRISEGIRLALVKLDSGYERIIGWTLDHAWYVVGGSVVLLLMSVGSVLLLGTEFLPEADEGDFSVYFSTRDDASAPFTLELALAIEEVVRREVLPEELLAVSAVVGGGGGASVGGNVNGPNQGAIFVALVDAQNRRRDIWSITRAVDQAIAAEVVDVDHRIQIEGMSALAAMGGGGGSAIQVRVRGRDLEQIAAIAAELETRIAPTTGTRNVRSTWEAGQPERQFVIRSQEASSLGLSSREIATTLRAAYNGIDVSTFRDPQGGDLDVVVLLDEGDRANLDRVSSLFLVNRAGQVIPLENLVDIADGLAPQRIERVGRERVVEVRGDLDGTRPLSDVTADVEVAIASLGPAPPGVEITVEGSAAEMGASFRSLAGALALAIALVYMVMASQFEDFIDPLIVMASVPFATIGMVLSLLITNTTFSILAFAGAILLVGIVVNNAIVLIDYMATLRDRGIDLREAIIAGGRTRLKPILMTTATTVLGLLPLAIGLGPGAELRYPMGRAVVGGLLTSTLITLVLIPAVYWLVEGRLKPWARGRRGRHEVETSTSEMTAEAR